MGWLRNLFGGKKRRAAAAGVPPRAELETRPLADLHLYASRLGVKRYRLLRREALVTTLLKETGQDTGPVSSNGASAERAPEPEAEVERPRGEKTRRKPERPPKPEPEPEPEPEVTAEREGVLDVTRRGHGFLRCDGLTRSPGDAYVSRGQIRRLELRSGDIVTAQVREARRSERYPSVVRVESVNGGSPDAKRDQPLERLEPAAGRRAFASLGSAASSTARIVDLVAPFGPGQSVLISSPAGVDSAAVLRDVGAALAAERGVELSVVALGPQSGDWNGWKDASAIDAADDEQSPGARVGIAQLAVERAKRRAEAGVDAVVLLDSATALADAHSEARRRRSDADEQESEGAGAGSASKLFDAARDTEQAGSLTIVAIGPDDGPLHDALAQAAAAEVVLDADLDQDSLKPPIDPTRSRTIDREALPDELRRRAGLRTVIDSLDAREAWEFVSERLAEADSNEALLEA